MTETRNILLIGSTGKGKSTLGNVLINRDGNFEEVFKEGEYATSETQVTGKEEFEESNVNYRIVDTVGIGDTKLSEKEVLYKIADAAYEVRDGLSQIFFVTSGRFNQQEIKAYNLLREIIFDNYVVNYTTIVRTNFNSFRKVEKCEEDKQKMIEETPELAEVIKSCKKVIHVDNPSVKNIEDEDELKVNLKKRKESREKLLIHLRDCQKFYKPKNLDGLNERIGNHMTEIEKLQNKLKSMEDLSEEERKKLQSTIDELKGKVSEQTQGWFKRAGALAGEAVDNAIEIVKYPFKDCRIS